MQKEKYKLWESIKSSKLMNKYIILIVVFSIFVLFFDSHNSLKRWKVKQENKNIKREINVYKEQLKQDSITIEILKNNTNNYEQFAREKYNIKKKNEDIYIITE